MTEKQLKVVGVKPDQDGWMIMTIEFEGKQASYRTKNEPTEEENALIQEGVIKAKTEVGVI